MRVGVVLRPRRLLISYYRCVLANAKKLLERVTELSCCIHEFNNAPKAPPTLHPLSRDEPLRLKALSRASLKAGDSMSCSGLSEENMYMPLDHHAGYARRWQDVGHLLKTFTVSPPSHN